MPCSSNRAVFRCAEGVTWNLVLGTMVKERRCTTETYYQLN